MDRSYINKHFNKKFKKYNDKSDERLGEVRMMNCGMYAKIIRYENKRDIDIQFDDNTIREHVTGKYPFIENK